MSTYIIGDVQGCFNELQTLLNLIDYKADRDRLGFVGDLVNRGPDSLAVLRFIKSCDEPLVVLGNHDFFLLALGYECMPINHYPHTLQAILNAPDKWQLLDWLRQQPLMIVEESYQAIITHAGIAPQWSISQALALASEVSTTLLNTEYRDFLTKLFGDHPHRWHDSLIGNDRLRYICNAFTRMRWCKREGDLWLTKTAPTNQDTYQPWFNWRHKQHDQYTLLFGHWAGLGGQCPAQHIEALDTGCAWGNSLTAYRLEDQQRFSVPCHCCHT